jgi:hypothetical protein
MNRKYGAARRPCGRRLACFCSRKAGPLEQQRNQATKATQLNFVPSWLGCSNPLGSFRAAAPKAFGARQARRLTLHPVAAGILPAPAKRDRASCPAEKTIRQLTPFETVVRSRIIRASNPAGGTRASRHAGSGGTPDATERADVAEINGRIRILPPMFSPSPATKERERAGEREFRRR